MRSVLVFVALAVASTFGAALAAPRSVTESLRSLTAGTEGVLVSSSTGALAARETAGPDTFVLYGGPDHPTEGKFQLADGSTADWGGGNGLPGGYGGGPNAWTPVDLTDIPLRWHQSTFNAANLNNNGPGNQAMWCGLEAGIPLTSDWVDAPGYGNGWFEEMLYESAPLADPSVGQEVSLEFFFNVEVSDITWDWFQVDYDSAGTWTRVLFEPDVDFGEPAAPGELFTTHQEKPIVYTGNDYGGLDGDRIRIRMLVTSDGAWSDEDGFGPTDAGLVQVDDITLTTSQGTFTEDYESAGPWLFQPVKKVFAGDFADVHPRMTDLDPCRENPSPVAAFMDYDQVLRNGPGVDGQSSTGGSTSPGVDYGIPGNWVVNYTGGLSLGPRTILNEIWSPEIQWDLPGTDDDGPELAGAVLEFDVWKDLPLSNGIFYAWHVRSAQPGQRWRSWQDRTTFHYDAGVGQVWHRHREVISDLLVQNPERVQIALGVIDYADVLFLPGNAATPSPAFDNVALKKVRVRGPVISTRTVDLAQDGFPPSGSVSVSSQANRDALDIPFDMARDVNSGLAVLTPGDSVIADVTSNIPGAWPDDIRMVWALRTNPLFEDAIRSAPARPVDENVVAGPSGTVWTGEVVASQSTTSAGYPVYDRYFFDLPDADFLYPGDVLHYYILATDTDGRVSTLPADLHDFGDLTPESDYDRRFVVRGLPSLQGGADPQPPVLVVNDHGHRGDEAEWLLAFHELGLQEGVDFDSYTVRAPESLVSNGIGSSGGHGAVHGQLEGYDILFYLSGGLVDGLLSTGDPLVSGSDKGNDLGVIDGWLTTLPEPRHIALFGDNVATAIAGPYSTAFMDIHMGVDAGVPDVIPLLGGQLAPTVVPNAQSAFASLMDATYVAWGGCTELRAFDQIQPSSSAEVLHWFTDAGGTPITSPTAGAASVVYVRPGGVSLTFPHAWSAVYPVASRAAQPSPQARLLADVFEVFAADWVVPPFTGAPPQRKAIELSVAPNPFNPRTTIEFTAPAGARGTVKIYTLRGELVRLLHSGEFHSTRFVWDGHDASGAAVASGVYVVRGEAEGEVRSSKLALVR